MASLRKVRVRQYRAGVIRPGRVEVSNLGRIPRIASVCGLRPEFCGSFRSSFAVGEVVSLEDEFPPGAGMDAPDFLPAGSVYQVVIDGRLLFVAPRTVSRV